MNDWEQLERLSGEAFALVLLRQDPVFGRIPPKKYGYYIRQGIRSGQQAAERWTLPGLARRLEEDGVEMCRSGETPPMDIHSEYCPAENGRAPVIRLYIPTLEKICAAAQRRGIPVTMEQLEQLHLAHEFYHHLEHSGAGDVSLTSEPVEIRLLGVIRRTRAVRSLREIAAHTFARSVCASPCHPLVWDWLLLNEEDEDQAKAFLNLCRQAEQSVKGA